MKPHVEALQLAIKKAGSQAKLASAIAEYLERPTFKQQTVSYWLRNEILLDPEWWPAIEHVTSGEVTRESLRPDVFTAAA
jgi:DNA-binding transcriptional regulator YdaS (Cro superfamily)